MHLLRDPVVTLEKVAIRQIGLESVDLLVTVRVENPNPLGITLRELSFEVLCTQGDKTNLLATGSTGTVKIAANESTPLGIPVTSRNAALISTMAAFVTKGGIQVTVRGNAMVDAVLLPWPVPFEKTVPVTWDTIADSLAGERKNGGNGR